MTRTGHNMRQPARGRTPDAQPRKRRKTEPHKVDSPQPPPATPRLKATQAAACGIVDAMPAAAGLAASAAASAATADAAEPSAHDQACDPSDAGPLPAARLNSDPDPHKCDQDPDEATHHGHSLPRPCLKPCSNGSECVAVSTRRLSGMRRVHHELGSGFVCGTGSVHVRRSRRLQHAV